MAQLAETPTHATIPPTFTLRARLGAISRFAEKRFNVTLKKCNQFTGALPMLQEKEDIQDYATAVMPSIRPTDQLPQGAALLKYQAVGLSPLLALEGAIHNHLQECRSLPAVLYVDSHHFLPALIEQYRRIKYAEFDQRYHYYTGHTLASIVIATERDLKGWAKTALGGNIPRDMVISAMSR